MLPKDNMRISIPGINGGEPFDLMEREDLWRRVYKVHPELFEAFESMEEDEEEVEEEPFDWFTEEYEIIYKYFDEGDSIKNIADSKDIYTYNYVRGVINNEKERRESGNEDT